MKFTKIKQIFPSTDPPRFNFGAWSESNTTTCLLGRQVINKSTSYYEPDVSSLLFVKIRNSVIIQSQIVWEPGEAELLEDPRAIQLSPNRVLLGLTAVVKESNIWKTYPALSIFNPKTLRFGDINIIQNFGHGKNTTPLSQHVFLFRPSRRSYFHKFLAFSFIDNKAKKICDISVPKVTWGTWKIGAASPPIWITKKRALMFLAGLNLVNGKYVYTIGKSYLEIIDGKYKINDIDTEPFITRSTFDGFEVHELHPEDREVVYMCGSVLNKNGNIDMYVNVGDRNTFIVTARLQDFL